MKQKKANGKSKPLRDGKSAGKQSFPPQTPSAPGGTPASESAPAANSMTRTEMFCGPPQETQSDDAESVQAYRDEPELNHLNDRIKELLLRMHNPLIIAAMPWMEWGEIMIKHPLAFARGVAAASDFRALLPLLELSDCKRAEESVRAAWSLRGSGSTKRLRALKWGSEEWWQQQEVMWLSANPEQMWPVVKACGRTGGEKVRDRLKKARKTGAADKRKLPDLLLSDWLFFGLWLFSDEAGVALLRAVHGFGVSSVTYADTVRHLRLYRRRPPRINVGESDDSGTKKKLYFKRDFREELSGLQDGGLAIRTLEVILT